MKTILDIGMDVYSYIKEHPQLKDAYRGKLILQQERTSDTEDIVVSVLSIDTSGDVHTAFVNVNIYVKDSYTKEGVPQANTQRIRELSHIFSRELNRFWGDGYRVELESERLLTVEALNEHLINYKLYYQHINERL